MSKHDNDVEPGVHGLNAAETLVVLEQLHVAGESEAEARAPGSLTPRNLSRLHRHKQLGPAHKAIMQDCDGLREELNATAKASVYYQYITCVSAHLCPEPFSELVNCSEAATDVEEQQACSRRLQPDLQRCLTVQSRKLIRASLDEQWW